MKIVFIDIDGVLNCKSTKETVNCKVNGVFRAMKGIDEGLLQTFVEIIKATKAEVVLISTWRNFPDAKQHFVNRLNNHGIKLMACTSCMGDTRSSELKGQEIDEFVEKYNKIIDKFVIIDDHKEAGEAAVGSKIGTFFQPDSYKGLTKEMAQEAIDYLNM